MQTAKNDRLCHFVFPNLRALPLLRIRISVGNFYTLIDFSPHPALANRLLVVNSQWLTGSYCVFLRSCPDERTAAA
jgi:hypothetical protein